MSIRPRAVPGCPGDLLPQCEALHLAGKEFLAGGMVAAAFKVPSAAN
jgi:hypothetical protein